MQLSNIVSRISDLDHVAEGRMQRRLDTLTKPQGSLGRIESLAVQLAGIAGTVEPSVDPAVMVVMAADHGVAAEGVSAFPAEVTEQMVHNFIAGGAAINVLSRASGAAVQVVDIGVKAPMSLPGLLSRKVRPGTDSMAKGPAMSQRDAVRAVEVGMEVTRRVVAEGARLIALGEMGIGNTTASSAVLSVLGQLPVERVVGTGTGIDPAARERKISVIEAAITLNEPNPFDPIDTVAKVGGLEIAGLAGVVLEAAALRIPIVMDGFITSVAALIAAKLCPLVVRYLISSHQSVEPGHQFVHQMLGVRPLLDLELRLGEASGAALALPLIRSAVLIPKEMSTFADAHVSSSQTAGPGQATPPPAAGTGDSTALSHPARPDDSAALSQPADPGQTSPSAARARHEFDDAHKQGVYRAIRERRDIRSFLHHPVETEKLLRILDAAHHAPSVGFMQPWSFVVVESDAVKRELYNIVQREVAIAGEYFTGKRAELYPKLKVHGILEAPVTLCVTNDPTRDGTHVLGRNTIPETDVYSVVCAIENLWLAARAEGLGVGWVSFYRKADVRDALGIPPHIEPVALLSIGYTAAFQAEPILESVGWGHRQSLENLLFSETWGSPFFHSERFP